MLKPLKLVAEINSNFKVPTTMSGVAGEFGSERLVQQIVDSILHATEVTERSGGSFEQVTGSHPTTSVQGREEEKTFPFQEDRGKV